MEPLYSGTWQLVAYGNDEGQSIVTPGLRTFASFQPDGNLGGNAGCNNFFGTFKAAEDGSFTVEGPLGSTLMFCEQFMDEETAFLTALQSAETFFFNESGQLVINFSDSADGYDFMVFVNQKSLPLLGAGWVLASLTNPDGEITVPPASAPVINFSEDGSLSGNGGCNNIMSEFTAEDGSISFSPIASTMMYCDGVMDLESSFTIGLEAVSRYEISGNRLLLSDDSYTTVLTFFAADVELTQTQWRLFVLNGEDVPEELTVTLTLSPGDETSEGTAFGSSGCNRYSGTYTMEADQLTINILILSAMMCDFGMETEDAFLAALQGDLTYQIQYNRLVLSSDTSTLVFLGEKPTLSGNWRVNTLGDPQNPVEVTFEQTVLAQFDMADGDNTGLLTGTTACNEFTARYFVDQNFITIGVQEMVDLNQCQSASEVDTEFFEALENAATYEFSRGSLLLRDGEGNQIVEFAPQF